MSDDLEEIVIRRLRSVTYPGMSRDIVSFGFVKDVTIADGTARIRFAPSTAKTDLIQEMRANIIETLSELEDVESVDVQLTGPAARLGEKGQTGSEGSSDPTAVDFEPVDVQAPGSAEGTAGPAQQPQGPRSIPGVKHVIAVASGKGGVGKSTVAVNLTEALARRGLKVGLADLDIYGPSAPTMLGIRGRPSVDEQDKIVPLKSRGIDVMSIGFILGENEPTIWRGPMVMQAVEEFLHQVDWGQQDVLIADMPPGTGDAQLSLMQTVALDGVVVVTTPQVLALLDVDRSVEMCREMNVPILGIVENMASFRCDECGKEHSIFGSGGGEEMARRLKVPFLGKVPMDPALREGGDIGRPLVEDQPDHPISSIFLDMAEQVQERLEQKEQEASSDTPTDT